MTAALSVLRKVMHCLNRFPIRPHCYSLMPLLMTALSSFATPPTAPVKSVISYGSHRLELTGTTRLSADGKSSNLNLDTSGGDITVRYHRAKAPAGGPAHLGVVWVAGAGGGFDGPAGVYPELCEKLQTQGISGLRLHYRRPNELDDCIPDTLAGVQFLRSEGVERVVLVGWSFGGTVVIQAGANTSAVKGVVTFASQTYVVKDEAKLSPRSLLLLHGTADTVLPDTCSRQSTARRANPRSSRSFPAPDTALARYGRRCSAWQIGFQNIYAERDDFAGGRGSASRRV